MKTQLIALSSALLLLFSSIGFADTNEEDCDDTSDYSAEVISSAM